MLLLSRRKLNPNPSYTPSRLTDTYVAGRPPLTLVTHRNPFSAAAGQTVEAEPPQSEILPRGIQDASIPPRPSPFLQLPPRRPPVRTDTEETLSPSSESLPQSQLPNIIPMPRPYPTPIRSRNPAPGEDVGEFATDPTPRHWSGSGHEYSHEYTAGYSYRPDTTPSPLSDSGPSHYRSADISGGTHAHVWPIYNKISQKFDKKLSTKWNDDLDVLLIFAALFSAIVTTFLITSLGNLQPNYQQQSALLMYQLLNGRDPSLASMSDPTAPFNPSGSAIAVNCLWFASLSMSLGTSFGAMVCKQWQTEYDNATDPIVDLLRACRRQVHFMTFQGWNIHATALLPPLLQLSVLSFFAGAVIFLWQIHTTVAKVYLSLGIMFAIIYLVLLPVLTKTPFRPYSALLLHRLSVAVGKVIVSIVDLVAHGCFLALHYVTSATLWPFAQTILSTGALRSWYEKARSIFPAKYKHMGVWWENAFDDSLDQIDTSPRVQEEAILWLSQMPLDTFQSEAVVSSLALISASRPHKFPKPVAVFLNSVLESSCREAPSRARVDCVLVLGRIKYQSVVDQNWDQDHTVGGIPLTPLVAYAAQQLTISAFEEKYNTPHSEGTRARLLAAAAWLSPVDTAEEMTPEGERLTIQGRWEFVKQIGVTLTQHIRGEKPLDSVALVDLIHGMHASIPRGNYGTPSSTIPFPLLTSEDYNSSWSKDESVLRALITYALDLLSYTERKKPLVERKVGFDELALELIDTLMVSAAPAEVVVFGFWLMYRVPYAFSSRKSMLADIILTWSLTNGAILEVYRKQLNLHAVNAFVAVARCRLIAKGKLPKLAAPSVLDLLRAALEDSCNQPVVTYALALILNLGTSAQAAAVSRGIDAESFANTLHTLRSDLEGNTTEEDALDLYIHTTLLLLKLRQPQVDIERVKTLIGEMGRTIGDVVVRLDPVFVKVSQDEISIDTDRVRWKAIYLSGLLVRFLPPGEWEGPIEALRGKVRKMLHTGQLPLATDHKRCLEPLDAGPLEFPTEREGAQFTAFEAWINDFPFLPLAGSVLRKE